MQRLRILGAWLSRRADDVVVLFLGTMFAAFIIQIAFRYVLNLPLGWTVEYVTIAWLWGIFFGYSFVVRQDEIIRLDLVYNLMPNGARRVMDVVSGLVCAAIFAWSIPKAWDYVTFMGVERTAFLRIRFDLLFSIYMPFAVVVIIRSLMTVWRALRGSPGHHTPQEVPVTDEYV